MEGMKRRGRPQKPRPGLLSPEQVAAIRGDTPRKMETVEEAAERREAERQRGIARRAEKKVLDSMSKAETIQQFWAESLKTADPVKLAEWQTRHEYVEALLGDIRTVLEGRSPDEEFADDVDEEIRADIKEHGVAGVTVLLIGPFWRDPELLAKLTSGDTPSAVFAKFGFLTGLPDLKIHQWNEFMAARAAQNSVVILEKTAGENA